MNRKHKPPQRGLAPMVGARPMNKLERNRQTSVVADKIMESVCRDVINRQQRTYEELMGGLMGRLMGGLMGGKWYCETVVGYGYDPGRVEQAAPAPEGPPVHLELTIDVSAFFARYGEGAARMLDDILGYSCGVNGRRIGNIVETRYSKIINGKARAIDKNNALEYKPEEAAK